jgi:hypothetical protein
MSEARQPGPQSAGRNVHYPDIVFGMLATLRLAVNVPLTAYGRPQR